MSGIAPRLPCCPLNLAKVLAVAFSALELILRASSRLERRMHMEKRLCYSICVFLSVLAVFPSLIWCQSNHNAEDLQSNVVAAEPHSADRPAISFLNIEPDKSNSFNQSGVEESILDPVPLILLIFGVGILATDRTPSQGNFLRLKSLIKLLHPHTGG
jgi:hypothetical protein